MSARKRAFTVIELLVAITIAVLIIILTLTTMRSVREKARDTKRLQEINQIIKALQLYWIENQHYPTRTCPCGHGGWETSDQDPEEFMEYLSQYLPKVPVDPINRRVEGFSFFGPRPGNYFYAYYRYETAGYCICDESSPTCRNVDRPFAVIAVSNLEAYVPADLPEEGMPLPSTIKLSRAVCGDPGPDGICTVAEYQNGQCRDWSQEFDYSIMLVE
ncbi:hypothetical protein J7K03_00220 [bacterium]|nr:hypothetical protein [bacterium]